MLKILRKENDLKILPLRHILYLNPFFIIYHQLSNLYIKHNLSIFYDLLYFFDQLNFIYPHKLYHLFY